MKVFYPAFNRGQQRLHITPANDGGADVSEFKDANGVARSFEVVFVRNAGVEVTDALGKYLCAKGLARRTRVPALLDGAFDAVG